MGIGGHMLGAVKLRRLQRLTGLPLDRAYIRGHDCEGVVWISDTEDEHYDIDPKTGQSWRIVGPDHWLSCAGRTTLPEAEREGPDRCRRCGSREPCTFGANQWALPGWRCDGCAEAMHVLTVTHDEV